MKTVKKIWNWLMRPIDRAIEEKRAYVERDRGRDK